MLFPYLFGTVACFTMGASVAAITNGALFLRVSEALCAVLGG